MKKRLLLFCLWIFPVAAYAQKELPLEPAILECKYVFVMHTDTITRSRVVQDTVLQRIGENISQFINCYTFTLDTLEASPQDYSKEILSKIHNGGFRHSIISNVNEYIYKNYPSGKTTTMSQEFIAGFYFEEEYQPQSWILLPDSTRQILNRECLLATCDFRNRTYFAWYCPEIPISDGPWKFFGLPGMILELYDANKDYHFVAFQIETENLTPVTLYNFDEEEYIQTDRITYINTQYKRRSGVAPEEIPLLQDVYWEGRKRTFLQKTPKRLLYDFMERDWDYTEK